MLNKDKGGMGLLMPLEGIRGGFPLTLQSGRA